MKDNPTSDQLTGAALEEALRRDELRASLHSRRAEAAELGPLLGLAQALIRTYADVPEPPGGLAAGRRRMLAEADHLLQHGARDGAVSPRIPVRRRPRMSTLLASKLMGILLACALGAAALGVGGVAAAEQSLPGSILYPAKLALEALRLEFALSPAQRVALALGYADARIAEIGALEEQSDDAAETAVARMESHLQYALDLAAQAPLEDIPGLLEQIMRRTQTQVQALQQLHAQVQVRNRVQVEQALQLCQQANREAANGLQEPQVFRSRYQERAGMPDGNIPPVPPSVEPGQDEAGTNGQQEQRQTQQQSGQQEQQQTQQQEQQQHQQEMQQQGQQQEQQQGQQSDQQQTQQQERQQSQQSDQQQTRQQEQQQQGQQSGNRASSQISSRRGSKSNNSKDSRAGNRVSTGNHSCRLEVSES